MLQNDGTKRWIQPSVYLLMRQERCCDATNAHENQAISCHPSIRQFYCRSKILKKKNEEEKTLLLHFLFNGKMYSFGCEICALFAI